MNLKGVPEPKRIMTIADRGSLSPGERIEVRIVSCAPACSPVLLVSIVRTDPKPWGRSSLLTLPQARSPPVSQIECSSPADLFDQSQRHCALPFS
jgi:hypothetical protein